MASWRRPIGTSAVSMTKYCSVAVGYGPHPRWRSPRTVQASRVSTRRISFDGGCWRCRLYLVSFFQIAWLAGITAAHSATIASQRGQAARRRRSPPPHRATIASMSSICDSVQPSRARMALIRAQTTQIRNGAKMHEFERVVAWFVVMGAGVRIGAGSEVVG